jgi:hypothetical protein
MVDVKQSRTRLERRVEWRRVGAEESRAGGGQLEGQHVPRPSRSAQAGAACLAATFLAESTSSLHASPAPWQPSRAPPPASRTVGIAHRRTWILPALAAAPSSPLRTLTPPARPPDHVSRPGRCRAPPPRCSCPRRPGRACLQHGQCRRRQGRCCREYASGPAGLLRPGCGRARRCGRQEDAAAWSFEPVSASLEPRSAARARASSGDSTAADRG